MLFGECTHDRRRSHVSRSVDDVESSVTGGAQHLSATVRTVHQIGKKHPVGRHVDVDEDGVSVSAMFPPSYRRHREW
jgi:hypothetical protein